MDCYSSLCSGFALCQRSNLSNNPGLSYFFFYQRVKHKRAARYYCLQVSKHKHKPEGQEGTRALWCDVRADARVESSSRSIMWFCVFVGVLNLRGCCLLEARPSIKVTSRVNQAEWICLSEMKSLMFHSTSFILEAHSSSESCLNQDFLSTEPIEAAVEAKATTTTTTLVAGSPLVRSDFLCLTLSYNKRARDLSPVCGNSPACIGQPRVARSLPSTPPGSVCDGSLFWTQLPHH